MRSQQGPLNNAVQRDGGKDSMTITDNLNIDPTLSPDGSRWVWPDGTSVPHVRGGSDTWPQADAPAADAPPAAAPAADAPPPADSGEAPPPAADAPPAAPADAPDPFYEGWNDEAVAAHKELKAENVRYKERFRPFEQAFGGLHADDQQFLLGFVDAIREQDQEALTGYAEPLRAYLDSLSPADQQLAKDALAAAAAAPATDPEFDPFDPKQIETVAERKVAAMLEEHERARQAAQEVADHRAAVDKATADLQASAAALATEHEVPEWGDPTSPLFATLVSVAYSQKGESSLEAKMAKAAEIIVTDLDRRAQALMKAKIRSGGEAPAPSGGDEPSGRKEPGTIKEAEASALRRIEAMQTGVTGN